MVGATKPDPQRGCSASHDILRHRLTLIEVFLFQTYNSYTKYTQSDESSKWMCCGNNIPRGLWPMLDVVSESREVTPEKIMEKICQLMMTALAESTANGNSNDVGVTVSSTQTEEEVQAKSATASVEDGPSANSPSDKHAQSGNHHEVQPLPPTSGPQPLMKASTQIPTLTLVQPQNPDQPGLPSDTTVKVVAPPASLGNHYIAAPPPAIGPPSQIIPLQIEIPHQIQLENELTPPIPFESVPKNVKKSSTSKASKRKRSSPAAATGHNLLQVIKKTSPKDLKSQVCSASVAPSENLTGSQVQVSKKTLKTRSTSKCSTITANDRSEETPQDFIQALGNKPSSQLSIIEHTLPIVSVPPSTAHAANNNKEDVSTPVVTLSSDDEEEVPPRAVSKTKNHRGVTIAHHPPLPLMGVPVPQVRINRRPAPVLPNSESADLSTAQRTARKSATQVPVTTASPGIFARIDELNNKSYQEAQPPVNVHQQVVMQKDPITGAKVQRKVQQMPTPPRNVGRPVKSNKIRKHPMPITFRSRPDSDIEEVLSNAADDTETVDIVGLNDESQQSDELIIVDVESEDEQVEDNTESGTNSQDIVRDQDCQKGRTRSEGSSETAETISIVDLEDNPSPSSPSTSESCSTTECASSCEGQDAAEVDHTICPSVSESDTFEDSRSGEFSSTAVSPEPPMLVENASSDSGMLSSSSEGNPLTTSLTSPSDTLPKLVPCVTQESSRMERNDEPTVVCANTAGTRNIYSSDNDDNESIDSEAQVQIVLLEDAASVAASAVPVPSVDTMELSSATIPTVPAVISISNISNPPPATAVLTSPSTIPVSKTPPTTVTSTNADKTTVVEQLEGPPAPVPGITPVVVDMEQVPNNPSTPKTSNISPSLPEDGNLQKSRLLDHLVPRRAAATKKPFICQKCQMYVESLESLRLHEEACMDESSAEDEPDASDSDDKRCLATKGQRKRGPPKRFRDKNFIYNGDSQKKISSGVHSSAEDPTNPIDQTAPPQQNVEIFRSSVSNSKRGRGRPKKMQHTKAITDTTEKAKEKQTVPAGEDKIKTVKVGNTSKDGTLGKRNPRIHKISLKGPDGTITRRTYESSSSDSEDEVPRQSPKRSKPDRQNGMMEHPVAGTSRGGNPCPYVPPPGPKPTGHSDDEIDDDDPPANNIYVPGSILRSRLSQNDNDVPDNQSVDTDVLSADEDPDATHILPSCSNSQATSTTTTAASTPTISNSSSRLQSKPGRGPCDNCGKEVSLKHLQSHKNTMQCQTFGAPVLNGHDKGDDSQTEAEEMEEPPKRKRSYSKGTYNRKEKRTCQYCNKEMLKSSLNKHIRRSCPEAKDAKDRGEELNYASQTEDEYDSQVEDDNTTGSNVKPVSDNSNKVECHICGMKMVEKSLKRHIKFKRCRNVFPETNSRMGENGDSKNPTTVSQNCSEVNNMVSDSNTNGPNVNDNNQCVIVDLEVRLEPAVHHTPPKPEKKKRGRPKINKAPDFNDTEHMCKFEDCNYIPESKEDYQQHSEEHSKDDRYPCKLLTCEKVFIDKENMEEHFRSHTREKMYYDVTGVAYAKDSKLQPLLKLPKLNF